MRIIVFLGLFMPVIIAGLSVYALNINKKILKLLIAFSGAYLISLIFNEIIPQIYVAIPAHEHQGCAHDVSYNDAHNHSAFHIVGLLILAGFFIQLILDYLTKGIEHGHMHNNHAHHEENNQKSFSFLPVFIGLILHSFLEGMPLAKGLNNIEMQNKLLTGIIIHNIPISIVMVSLMIHQKIPRIKSFVFLAAFALAAPAGAFATHLFGSAFLEQNPVFINYIMAVVVGIFLHISTTILFETDENHKFNFIKFITMIIGAGAAIIHF